MGNYFYGRITKSGKKLLVNIPIKKTQFEYNRLVKVFLLPKDIDLEVMEKELETSEALNDFMNLNDAGQIIRDLDPQYDFKGKSGDQIREHAKRLRG